MYQYTWMSIRDRKIYSLPYSFKSPNDNWLIYITIPLRKGDDIIKLKIWKYNDTNMTLDLF